MSEFDNGELEKRLNEIPDLIEKRRFLAEVVRTPPSELSTKQHLIRYVDENGFPQPFDKLLAIELDSILAGHTKRE